MSRRDDGPRTVSAEEASKGCRRIVGFLFAGWFIFGLLFAFIRDNDIRGFGSFDVGGILNFGIPIAIFVFVIGLISRRNRARSREGGNESQPAPTRRVESIRVEPRQTPPAPGPKSPPRSEVPSLSTPKKPAPTPAAASQPPPQTLQEALEELGMESSEDVAKTLDLDLGSTPKSSQEMIEDARQKWGKGPRPGRR